MDKTCYVPKGNATETSLLRFLQDADIPVHLLIQQKLGQIIASSPFSSAKKRSITVMRNFNQQGMVTIYIKGAPEIILSYCESYQVNGGAMQMAKDQKDDIEGKFRDMASKPLRVIGFAFLQMREE